MDSFDHDRLGVNKEPSESMLALFPHPPLYGHITVEEVDGELEIIATNPEWVEVTKVAGYPSVHIRGKDLSASGELKSSESAFLQHKPTSKWQAFRDTLNKKGVTESMTALLSGEDKPGWSEKLAGSVVSVSQTAKAWLCYISPVLMPVEEAIQKYGRFKNWRSSPVRAIAWHPRTVKLAVATEDDGVLIYNHDPVLVPKLSAKQQKNITDMAWQPLSSSLLVVACERCLVLWTIEPGSNVSRPSSKCMQVVDTESVTPVISVCWSPDGSLLMCGSPYNSSVMVSDGTGQRSLVTRKTSSMGVTQVKWSPDGQKVFSAAPIPQFRVWTASSWTAEKWTKIHGRCTAACWSACGQRLLFAVEGDSRLHCLTFLHRQLSQGSQPRFTCSVVANLAPVHCKSDDMDDWLLGGTVQDMAWDDKSKRLAIIFKDGPGTTNDYVTLFRTSTFPTMELSPVGFIKGLDTETPQAVCFKDNFAPGALLTVVWSSGRLGYVPMYFGQAGQPNAVCEEANVERTGSKLFSTANTDTA